jgi:hypothetical protein
MESNTANQECFIGESPLPEPHFDEEATVLSARPVVPLQAVKAEERSRKRLLFGLAMSCSLMLGALAATLIYKQRGNGQATAISTAVPGAGGIAVEGSGSVPAVEEVRGAAKGTVPETRVAKAEQSFSRGSASTVVEAKPKDFLREPVQESELTRSERINARRLQRRFERQARRESIGRQRKSSDEVLRIREIFEGRSRP